MNSICPMNFFRTTDTTNTTDTTIWKPGFMALSLPFPSLMLKLSVYLENGTVIKSIGEFSV